MTIAKGGPPVVDELPATLRGLASRLVVDVGETEIADALVACLVKALAPIRAGVTLIDAHAEPRIAASDPEALRFEHLQSSLREGPCFVAHELGIACLSPDLASDRRFGQFGPAAAEAGLGAVFALPLRFGDRSLGAVDLYRDVAGSLDQAVLEAAQVISDVVAAFLVNARARVAQQELSARLRDLAYHDLLTGLPNRALLLDRLRQALLRRARSGQTVAVVFLDLDGFKSVNDQHGHLVGDQLLIAFADRLSAVLRPSDTLARLGGDEFVILYEDLDDPRELDTLLTRVGEQIAPPFDLAGPVVRIEASIGTAVSAGDGDGDTPEALVDAADRAMYARKSGCGNLRRRGRSTLD